MPSADIAGLPFRFALKDGFVRPLAVTLEHPEITIPVNRSCTDLYLLGSVTVLAGYPLQGKHGEVAAVLEKRYTGGRIDRMPLRNGIEIARSNIIHGATRIEPIASAAPRALLYQKDPAREQYQALLLSSPVSGQLAQIRLVWKSGPPLLFFAITTTSTIQRVSTQSKRRLFLGAAGALASTTLPSFAAPQAVLGQRHRISLTAHGNSPWQESDCARCWFQLRSGPAVRMPSAGGFHR